MAGVGQIIFGFCFSQLTLAITLNVRSWSNFSPVSSVFQAFGSVSFLDHSEWSGFRSDLLIRSYLCYNLLDSTNHLLFLVCVSVSSWSVSLFRLLIWICLLISPRPDVLGPLFVLFLISSLVQHISI